MKNNKKNGILVLIIILIIAVISAVLGFVFPAEKKNGFKTRENPNIQYIMEKKSRNGYLASIYINGVIQTENAEYNQKWLLQTISQLKNDKNNKGIVIIMNSPGGAVYEADEAYLAFQDYKTTGKPVYVYQEHLAASGGYYISCAANKIYANRNTLTGSIGVISGSSYDLTGLFDKLGIKSETIHSGKNKNMFSINEKVTDEQRKIMQSISDECYEQFTAIVSVNRNIPLSEVKKIADGRIYTANQALQNGLIDGIDTKEGMLSIMYKDCFNGQELPVIDFKYEKNQTFRDYLFGTLFKGEEKKAFNKFLAETTLQYPAFLYN